jgi:hypothetical protein
MPVERASGGTSLIDVLDRVLDKGVVVDAWARVALAGIDLLTEGARIVVASVDTCFVPGSGLGARTPEELLAENASLRAQLAAFAAREEAPARRPRLSARH